MDCFYFMEKSISLTSAISVNTSSFSFMIQRLLDMLDIRKHWNWWP